MREQLLDLYGHQAWADAESWRTYEAHPPALEDNALRQRLHHVHLVQRFFLAIARREKLQEVMPITKPGYFATPADLKRFAQDYHAAAATFVGAVDEATLNEVVVIPWFTDPPLSLPIGQALTQAALHTHYHRGQNATRLRELGGEPAPTDYIVWLWKQKPPPQWSPTAA